MVEAIKHTYILEEYQGYGGPDQGVLDMKGVKVIFIVVNIPPPFPPGLREKFLKSTNIFEKTVMNTKAMEAWVMRCCINDWC